MKLGIYGVTLGFLIFLYKIKTLELHCAGLLDLMIYR